ncbi:type II secretion system F family protein [Cellulomonas xylanilytica]|uniref:Type II secretion system protein n=1 Tax=Cellulomonas xylanilytica TaxID=233583 RepID=A0A510V7Q4_9CELL|nr:type II secretion system F family protein [Cellulomonas xylanilytica]GEK22902.1 type II secretion system protein [Cellulomonas xylanilytica]
MTGVLVAGAIIGLGLLILVLVLIPPASHAGSALARLDQERLQGRARAAVLGLDSNGSQTPAWQQSIGRRATSGVTAAGFELRPLRSDLAIVGLTLDAFLARSVIAGVVGLLVPLVLGAVATVLRLDVNLSIPLILSLVIALIAMFVPWMALRSAAAERRRDFRHVVGSFLDLVAMSLAGGRGVPEALQGASELSDGWAMVRIRNALGEARLRGATPWAALGALGEELQVDELRDLAAALALVAEDGAKVRDSLSARAGSMRRRELAEAEGKAGESSESMLVAQLLLAVGFLVFLVYPAIVTVMMPG